MKGYEKYLPERKEVKMVLFQTSIPEQLRDEVKAILEREQWTWQDFTAGLFQKYIDDHKSKKTG